MKKDTTQQVIEHDVKIEDLEDDVSELQKQVQDMKNKGAVREWLYTKCIWVWTIFLGWLMAIGAYVADHYEKVYIVLAAALKALQQSGKQ